MYKYTGFVVAAHILVLEMILLRELQDMLSGVKVGGNVSEGESEVTSVNGSRFWFVQVTGR